MEDRFLPDILDSYIRSLMVNTKGDPIRANENWPGYDEVLERFYQAQESECEVDELEAQFLQELLEENKGNENDD